MSQIITDFTWAPENVVLASERFKELIVRPPQPPKIDEMVSKVVGRNILVNDPRLIRLIVKWKKESNKPDTDTSPDNFLRNEEKVKELKEVFA